MLAAMTFPLRAAVGFLALAALSSVFSCKSTSDVNDNPGQSPAGEAGANDQTSAAGEAGQNNSNAGASATPAGGATAQVSRGLVLITQAAHYSEGLMRDIANASLAVSFATRAEAMREQGASTTTIDGDCSAYVLIVDPNAVPAARTSGLNAGVITVTCNRLPPTFAADYVDNGAKGPSNYGHAEADSRFYGDGDVLSVQGSGGPDLPAFDAVTLAAPSNIVLIAPACATGTCDDVDHTRDFSVEWTEGGAGKIDVLFETVAETKVVLLECKFDAQAGQGVVPASLLAKLDVVDGSNVSGILQITPVDEKTFPVGDVNTTFSIRSAEFEALLQPAN